MDVNICAMILLGKFVKMEFMSNICAYTSQYYGTAERKNRHLLELTRLIIFVSHVPNSFQDEAILTTPYLINRLPSKSIAFYTLCVSYLNSFLDSYPKVTTA